MLNIAVIGAGKLGEFHIKLIKTSTKFNLVGFHEKNKERLNVIANIIFFIGNTNSST